MFFLYASVSRSSLLIRTQAILDWGPLFLTMGAPRWLSSKESACFAGAMSSVPGSQRSPGKGNGNTLQYSCLENPMDWGAWRATVHRVAKSQTWLKQLSMHSSHLWPHLKELHWPWPYFQIRSHPKVMSGEDFNLWILRGYNSTHNVKYLNRKPFFPHWFSQKYSQWFHSGVTVNSTDNTNYIR